jgi:glycosyltransferase involved in cell wall biosynthesis
MARIVTVYTGWYAPIRLVDMSFIRWFKISEALARRGHQVDIATNEMAPFRWWRRRHPLSNQPNLRTISLRRVRWEDYDVVKTLFHVGFETLRKFGGVTHPFIISKLGSVVGSKDLDGIPFYGETRKRMLELQEKISYASRYVTVLSAPAKHLWQECYGDQGNVLLVPGGVDADIPSPGKNPFPDSVSPRCIFAGNIYSQRSQPGANAILKSKLNQLGKSVTQFGIRLYFLGVGDSRGLDKRYITCLGHVPYEQSWGYLQYSDVGVVVAADAFMHNNESTKIYHYLRAGLPTVSEKGFPNDNVVTEAKLGFVVENGNPALMAEKIRSAVATKWNTQRAVDYIIKNHTWDQRVEVYHDLISSQL